MKGGGINALPRGEEPSLEMLVFHSVCHASFLPRPVQLLISHSPLALFRSVSPHTVSAALLTSCPVSFGFACLFCARSTSLVLCLVLVFLYVCSCLFIHPTSYLCVNLLPPLCCLSFASCRRNVKYYIYILFTM